MSTTAPADDGPSPWRVGLLVFATRLGIALGLNAALGGHEFTDDAHIHLAIARAPFGLFELGERFYRYGQYPPLLPVAEWPIAWLLPILGPFLAIRTVYAAWESVAAGFTVAAARDLPRRGRLICAVGLLLTPMGWMTSAFMAQDESVAMAFVAVTAWALMRQRPAMALLVLAVGVVAAKQMLAAPLLVLVAGLRWRSLAARAVLAAAVPSVVLAAQTLAASRQALDPPLMIFAPPAMFTVNGWYWLQLLGVAPEVARSVSGALVGAGTVAFALAARRRGVTGGSAVAAVAATLTGLWLAFYHVNPEYWALTLPVLALTMDRPAHAALLHVFLPLPWAVNFFYGVQFALTTQLVAGKGPFVDLYERLFPGDPGSWHAFALAWVVTLGTGLLVWSGRATVGRSGT